MSDARAPELPSLKVIRPGSRVGLRSPSTEPKLPRESCSAVGAFAICKQYHGFAYELGLQPTEKREPLVVGGLWHVGLAYRYGLRMNPRPAWMVYPTPEAPNARDALWTCGQEDLDLAGKALRLFDAYEAWYTVPTLEPILIEHQFEVVYEIDGQKVKYTLRIDLLARDHSFPGAPLTLFDHKSAYKLTKYVGHDYRADREMLTGLALCRAHGYDVQRVVINAMSKGTKEDPTPKFQRYEVPISVDAYSRIGMETEYWLRDMKNVRQAFPDPHSRPRSLECCVRKYGRCDFYPVCADGPQNLAQYTRKW